MLPTRKNSLLLLSTDNSIIKREIPAYDASDKFRSVHVLRLNSKASGLSQEIDLAAVRRLYFLSNGENLSQIVTPLVIASLWKSSEVTNLVIGYPEVDMERLTTAAGMLESGCEAVMLRTHEQAPLVIGLARTIRNERLVVHWADHVRDFSLGVVRSEVFDLRLPGELIEYLCDRVGSLRGEAHEGTPVAPLKTPQGVEISSSLKVLIRDLFCDSELLQDDPLLNAVKVLNEPAQSIHQDKRKLITSLGFRIWSMRPDLQQAFDLSSQDGRSAFVDWFLARAQLEFGLDDAFVAPVRSHAKSLLNYLVPTRTRARRDELPFSRDGLNLIGYPRAEMGMGEQLRACARALASAGVDFSTFDFNCNITASQRNTELDQSLRKDNPHRINLFHINADQLTLVREKLGAEFFRDHYNIGYWAWELSRFPDAWLEAVDLMDEIWAPSTFIQNAISQKTSKPVILMPLAIEFDTPAGSPAELRHRFGLPEQAFLFLFSFDLSSYSTRKNPAAVIEAFRRAFQGSEAKVGLVIKTIRHPHHRIDFWKLLREIGENPQIYLVDRLLRQTEMRELIACCDSFVSLHRSEGFGLGMGESMFLGKPVIATGYSGNADFTKEDNSCLVDYQLIPLSDGDYQFPQGQVWAEPNVDSAAEYMRRLTSDHGFGRAVGNSGAAYMRRHHSAEAIGKRYADRLKQIDEATKLMNPPDPGRIARSGN